MIDIGFAGSLLGGMLSLFSPCSVMLLPAFFAHAFGTVREILGRTLWFYLGLLVTLVPMGMLAGTLGSLIANRAALIGVVAWLIVATGALMVSGIELPGIGARITQGSSRLSVFLLGTVYVVAGVCAGPILGSVLLVASLGSPAYGVVLMGLYAAGMCIPLVVLAIIWGRLGRRGIAWLAPRTVEVRLGHFTWRNSWMSLISGFLTLGLGIFLLVNREAASLGGWLATGTQFEVEARTLEVSSRIPDLVVAIGVVVCAGVGIWCANRATDD